MIRCIGNDKGVLGYFWPFGSKWRVEMKALLFSLQETRGLYFEGSRLLERPED
jgi:hypothetical protein